MIVAACVKLVDLRPEVDRLTGAVTPSTTVGCSAADRAAVELALQLADSWSAESAVLCCGPDRADPVLREFAAAGVDRLVRIDAAGAPDSVDVGGLLAATLRNLDVGVVVCGDHSLDRGSGAVPAYVADGLGAAQALGLVEVRTEGVGTLRATRRLDGGRRERLLVDAPCVVSVEGSVAELRRASLAATLRSDDAVVEVVAAPGLVIPAPSPTRPWVPPTRVQPPPRGADALERVVELTGAMVERTPPRTVELPPERAAALIVEQLRTWGYLESERPGGPPSEPATDG